MYTVFNSNEHPAVDNKVDFPGVESQELDLNCLKIGTRVYWPYNKKTLSGERVDLAQAAESRVKTILWSGIKITRILAR